MRLPAQEFTLLALMLKNQNRIFAKATIEERLQDGSFPSSNAVEALVSRLRKKLAEAGVEGAIRTVRGLGYVIRDVTP